MKKPFELLLSALALVGTGALGLIGVYLSLGTGQNISLLVILATAYGLAHPILAYLLWTTRKGALKAAKIGICFFLFSSFFLYQIIYPIILILNSLVYAYTMLYLVRPDIRDVFK
jgi:chromate transport protein ChrA